MELSLILMQMIIQKICLYQYKKINKEMKKKY